MAYCSAMIWWVDSVYILRCSNLWNFLSLQKIYSIEFLFICTLLADAYWDHRVIQWFMLPLLKLFDQSCWFFVCDLVWCPYRVKLKNIISGVQLFPKWPKIGNFGPKMYQNIVIFPSNLTAYQKFEWLKSLFLWFFWFSILNSRAIFFLFEVFLKGIKL